MNDRGMAATRQRPAGRPGPRIAPPGPCAAAPAARERLVARLMDAFDDVCREAGYHWAAAELLAIAEGVVARWAPDEAPAGRQAAAERVARARRRLV